MKILIAIDFDEIATLVESVGFGLAKKLNAPVVLIDLFHNSQWDEDKKWGVA